jgi:hypothetical protein
MKQIIRPISVLVASGVAAVALLAACGGDPGKATSTAAPEQVAAATTARLEAQAQHYERWAHLQGQARTYGAAYGRADSSQDPPAPADENFVPGSRHMPMR